MKKLLPTLAATIISLGSAQAATAQDVVNEPAAGDDAPFSGFYVAASGGYDVQGNDVGQRLQFDRNGDGSFNDTVTTAAGADAFSPGFCNGRAFNQIAANGCENDRNRGSYYGRVGFDVQRGMFVVGALGEFGKTDIKDYVTGFSTTPAAYVLERGVRWEASARLRAGIALGEGRNAGMFYATGGAGYANIRRRLTVFNNSANSFADNGNDRKWGFIVGGGVEKFLTRNISIGAEYTYHDYKDKDYRVSVTRGTAPVTNPFVLAPNTAGTTIRRSDPDFRWHSLRATVGFHF